MGLLAILPDPVASDHHTLTIEWAHPLLHHALTGASPVFEQTKMNSFVIVKQLDAILFDEDLSSSVHRSGRFRESLSSF